MDERQIEALFDMEPRRQDQAGYEHILGIVIDAAMRLRLVERHRLDGRTGSQNQGHGDTS